MKYFPPFRFDLDNHCLWQRVATEERRIPLTPKAFAVLKYLVDRAPRLVPHRELLDAVWPNTIVQPEVLSSHIRDLRASLGDDPRKPKYIETHARRGYRFIADVSEGSSAAAELHSGQTKLVGRDGALAELHRYLALSLAHKRQIVFVTGELGIGKTALVDEFQRRVSLRRQEQGPRIVHGQCIEGYGGHEAYCPILKAVGELCRGPGGHSIVSTLATQAPTWLVQFPTLLERNHRDALHREILGATPQRMLREISEALETITAATSLLMILEDLHWADSATLDFISEIARRRGAAQLMVVMTYRPLDATLANHPLQRLKQDLLVRHLCHEIALSPLREADIAEYLGSGGAADTGHHDALARILHQHSEGNPLFIVAALEEMSERGLVARRDATWQAVVPLEEIHIQVPETLRQMIEIQIDRLTPAEQGLLEVAAELAEHFAESLDWLRAIQYQVLAAGTAQHRFAHREAETLLRGALQLVERIPASARPALETTILEKLATTYVASFDMRCIETYETLAARAQRYGLLEVEVNARVDLVYCLSWFNATRALEVLEEAFRLAEVLPGELLRACVRMNCLVARVWVGGWNSRDAQEALDALAVIRAADDRYLLAPHLIGYSQIQWIFSEYRQSYAHAVEGLTLLTERGGPNPYLSIPFQRGQTVRPRSLLFLGEWGKALQEIDVTVTLADRNGDYLPAQILRLNRAWVHLEAMDFLECWQPASVWRAPRSTSPAATCCD